MTAHRLRLHPLLLLAAVQVSLLVALPARGQDADPPGPPAWKAADGEGILFNFEEAELDAVLNHLSEAAGLVIVKKNGKLDGRITVQSRQPLSVDEAINVLNSVLREKGYAGVRVGRMLKIVEISEAVKSNIPVRVGADPEEIAETDEMITQVIPLKRLEARQLRQDLEALFSDEASVTANQSSNALIITDSSANIRRIAKVIVALDEADPSETTVEVFALKYAEATDTARLINEIFGESSRSRSSRGRGGRDGGLNPFFLRFRGRGDGSGGGTPGSGGDRSRGSRGGTGGGALAAPVNASADERTNTVVVSGPPETVAVVGEVLEKLDSNPASRQEVFIYHVKNGQAVQMANVVNTLFGTGGTGGSSRGGGRGGSDPRSNTPLRSSSGFGAGGGGRGGGPTGGGGPGGGGGRGGGAGRVASESLESAAELYGQVYAVADEDTNSLLIMTAPTALDTVKAILKQLDMSLPQVLIKVLIAEVTHTDGVDIGAEFSILDVPQDSNLFTDFGLAAQSGGMIYRMLEQDVQATIRLLAENSKLEVLSRPYILASDNQEATITVGQEVPFIRNTRITQNDATINTIEYEDVGIILSVTPHTSPDGIVTLDVAPEISAISGETVPISETVDAPVIAKRSASTRVAIPDGQTIVIGGLMEDQVTESVQKVPFLGDIPLIGAAFRRVQKTTTKTELLIFLTPHVVKNPYALKAMTKEEKDGIEILHRAVEDGAFERQLEGMERGKSPDAGRADAAGGKPPPDPTAEETGESEEAGPRRKNGSTPQ